MRWLIAVSLCMALACAAESSQPTVQDLLEADRAFASDGVMFQNGKPVIGHDAIRQAMQPAFEGGFSLTWEPVTGEISASGDLGYTRGRWDSRTTDEDGVAGIRTGV